MTWIWTARWAPLLCDLALWIAIAESLLFARRRQKRHAELDPRASPLKVRGPTVAMVAIAVCVVTGGYEMWKRAVRENELRSLHGPTISPQEQVGVRMGKLLSGSYGATNWTQLVTAYNRRFKGDDLLAPLRTNGNPLPGVLPKGSYFWLSWWGLSKESLSTPLLWCVPQDGGKPIEYLTLRGEWERRAVEDFRKLTQPFSNRVVNASSETP